MTPKRRLCFVIMPFRDELHYFYLYLQHHIETRHGVECKRGDADILTVPLLDKIRAYIENADVIIADCSGRNSNVFYELGMAHALGKKVILITHDTIDEAPVDVRHFEFIRYHLARHDEFLAAVDRALRAVFVDRYDQFYKVAIEVFDDFRRQTTSKPVMVDKTQFIDMIAPLEQSGQLPPLEDAQALREFLLPKIVSNKDQREVIEALARWYSAQLSGAPGQ